MAFKTVLLLSVVVLCISKATAETTPIHYYIKPVGTLLLDSNCNESSSGGGYNLCNQSSLLLDSVHGPQPYSQSARDSYYTQLEHNGRTLFQFASEIDIQVIQVYYYVERTSSSMTRTRITVYSIPDDDYVPRYPLPETAEQLGLIDGFMIGTQQFNQLCFTMLMEASGVKNVLFAPTTRNTALYISEVNFFTGDAPEGTCDGIFTPVETTAGPTYKTTAEIITQSTTASSTTTEKVPDTTTDMSTTTVKASPTKTSTKDEIIPSKGDTPVGALGTESGSGLSTAAVGVIIVLITLAVILTTAVAIIVIIALIITKKRRTYKVSESSRKNSNIYTEVPTSSQSVSDDSSSVATTGTSNPAFIQSQAEAGDSKFTTDFKVSDVEKD